MSSFKRKSSIRQATLAHGTKYSSATQSTIITSTGIPSLDDILGGGLPLSCSLLMAAPDLHSSYGELVLKYFVAEGLACGHEICLITGNPMEYVKDVMWMPKGSSWDGPKAPESDDDENSVYSDQKVKIAWRYEQMKQFPTTVHSISSSDNFCHLFDLSNLVPESMIDEAVQSNQLLLEDINALDPKASYTTQVLARLASRIGSVVDASMHMPLRICIPSLGSPDWGDISSEEMLYFLHALKALLRKYPRACASISLSPHISTDIWGGNGWVQKLGWVSDAAITLSAFSANPSLSATFPSHHGLVHIHTLPAPHTLLPPSDRFSTLRGLSAMGTAGGSGENNLAFKCTRKRLIFETLHLDLEGGVSERRTTPSSNVLETTNNEGDGFRRASIPFREELSNKMGLAAVNVQLESEKQVFGNVDAALSVETQVEIKPKKQKKSVAFRSDRPDLYDF